ncbi:hypothetical protein AAF712_006755 [Marasmius tenuissimus]|uniref:Uncharacterized protein n=1 Tax=Marasmius tenuissimus TaxID=585030 RepID=A0ABR2ZX03_9AGAR
MGGFALYDSEGKFLFHLWDERFCEHFKDEEDWDGFSKQQRKLKELLPYGRDQSYSSLLEYCVANNMITMTEEEIQSLGHTDLLAKTITIFQTLYFITNCIARGLNGIGATELEAHPRFCVPQPGELLVLVAQTLGSSVSCPRPGKNWDPLLPTVLRFSRSGRGTKLQAAWNWHSRHAVRGKGPGILSAFSNRIRDDYGDDKEWDTLSLRDRMLRILLLLLRACSLLGSQIAFLLLPNLIVTELLPTAVTMAVETRAFPPQPERGTCSQAPLMSTDTHAPL